MARTARRTCRARHARTRTPPPPLRAPHSAPLSPLAPLVQPLAPPCAPPAPLAPRAPRRFVSATAFTTQHNVHIHGQHNRQRNNKQFPNDCV